LVTVSIAVVPGSYDPVTLGHRDIFRRARALFDEVVIGVAENTDKHPLLSLEERIVLVERSVRDLTGVRVMAVPGLLADFCKGVGASCVVKGLRGGADLAYEQPMALINRNLADIETVFLVALPKYAHISSSIVKDVAANGGNIGSFVPKGVQTAVFDAFADRTDEPVWGRTAP
jgi:pantetheine-phosphate adenylyltransferase